MKPHRLTPRTRQVLRLIAEGHSTKQIAYAMGISYKTADTHRRALYVSLDLHSIAMLTRYAVRIGLVEA